jgi:membrane protein implicated in regulation of membrane protease activity
LNILFAGGYYIQSPITGITHDKEKAMETLKNLFTDEVIWFLIGIVLLIMEFATPGLVIFFFGVGAIVVGVVCIFLNPSFTVQLAIFLVSSVILLFGLRKWLKKVFLGRRSDSETELIDTIDNFVGERAVVLQKITPSVAGSVELHGTAWKAEADEEIKKGTPVEVIGKKNLLLKVKPVKK